MKQFLNRLYSVFGFCLFLSLSLPVSVRAAPVDAGQAIVDLVTDHQIATPGSQIRGALTLDMEDHWHVYWKNPGDSGLPAEIDWLDTAGVEIGEFAWPIPHPQPIETLMNYGYEDKLVLPFTINIPETASGMLRLSGIANYLICKDVCIPESANISASVLVGTEMVENDLSKSAFEWADARLPMALDGKAAIDRSADAIWKLSVEDAALRAAFSGEVKSVRFFPTDHQILHPPVQTVMMGDKGITLSLQKGESEFDAADPLSGVLAIEDINGNRVGFELTATSGSVFAGTNDTALNMSDAAPAADLGVIAFVGVLLAALLGGAILNLMPCVLPVLFIKVQSFLALSGHESAKIRSHGLFYMLGVVTCFVGFGIILAMLRSAGEQVGLGFQLQVPIIVAGLALLMFVLGLNMLGMFEFGGSMMGVGSGLAEKGGAQGAFFTGVLAAFVGAPCVGPFIGGATGILLTQSIPAILLVFACLGLGMALPFAVLSFFPGLVKLLPKPGQWMQRLKQFFAFPLFLTAIWLISVLGDLAGQFAMTVTAFGAVMIAFAIWLLVPDGSGERKGLISRGAGVVALLIGIVVPAVPLLALSGASSSASVSSTTTAKTEIYDGEWSPERVKQLQSEGKAVFIDFTASWCVTCQVNKATTLHSAQVQKAFDEHNVVVLIADWTRRDKKIGEELARHGRAGVPLYLFYPQGYPQGGEAPVVLPQLLSPSKVIEVVSAKPDKA